MKWWPWITREHHAEVVAAKEAQIRTLEVQNAVLAARLAEPVAVTVKLADDFAMQPVRRPRPKEERPETPPAIDLGNIDENDNAAIARIVAKELNGNMTPWLVARKVASIKAQIRMARRKKDAEHQTNGRVATIGAPHAEEDPDYVPSFVKNLIAEAERV